MRLILKILAAPVVLILTIVVAFCKFIVAVSGAILSVVAVIIFLLGVACFFIPMVAQGIAVIVLAFLISPLGIPAFAGWFVERVDDLNGSLKSFITG